MENLALGVVKLYVLGRFPIQFVKVSLQDLQLETNKNKKVCVERRLVIEIVLLLKFVV